MPFFLTLILAFFTLACAAQGAEHSYQSACASCHGLKGEGNATLKTPSIGGLPSWYTRVQIEKIKTNLRATQSNDVQMLAMQTLIAQLPKAAITSITKEIAALPRHPTRNTLGGDPKAGEKLFEWHCIECHRYNASGEKVFGSPPLTGLQDWYMAAQFKKFKDQTRGKDSDESGYKMHQVVQRIADPQALVDILAYIATLAADTKP